MRNGLSDMISRKKVLLLCLRRYIYLLRPFGLFDLQSTILDNHFKPNIFSQHLSQYKSQHTTESLSKGHIDYLKTKNNKSCGNSLDRDNSTRESS